MRNFYIKIAFLLFCTSPTWAQTVNVFPKFISGTDAAKPSSCDVPSFYQATDTNNLYVCNQGGWQLVFNGGGVAQVNVSGPPSFGSVQNGTASPTQDLIISNPSSSQSFQVTGLNPGGSNPADFISPNLSVCNIVIAPGKNCHVSFFFRPSGSIAESSTITVVTTAPVNPGSPLTVTLQGTGTPTPTFSLTVGASNTSNGSGSVQSGDGTNPCTVGQTCVPPTLSCSFVGASGNSPCGNNYATGTVVSLTGTGTTGNIFNGFTVNGSPCILVLGACNVTMNSNTVVTVTFTAVLPTSNLNVTGTGQGTVTVTSDVGDASGIINCLSTAGVITPGGGTGCTGAFNQGIPVTLTAAVGGSFTFIGWSGAPNCTTALICVVTIPTTNITVTANVAPTSSPLNLVQIINGGTPGTNNIVGNFGQAQNAGDTNIVFIDWNDATKTVSTVTDTSGNTYTQASCAGSPQTETAAYYSVGIAAAAAGANSITVAMSGSPPYRVIMASEYAGVTAFDICHGANGTGTALDSGAFLTTAANDLLIGGDNVAHGISAVSTGYTQQIANSGNDVEDLRNVAIATYHFQPTQSPTGLWQAIGLAFKSGGVVNPSLFSVTVVGGGNGNGNVAIPGSTCVFIAGSSSGCSFQAAFGATPTLIATAASGSNFGGWLGVNGCSVSSSCAVPSITTNTVLTVNFSLPVGSGPFNILNQPPVSNRPYPAAYFNKKLPNAGNGGPSTHQMPNSNNIVSTVMQNGGSSLVTSSGFWNSPGTDDGQHRSFGYGQVTDPVYQISGCTGPSTSTSVNGQKFHAPSAFPYNQGSFDKEGAIWEQTTDIMFQFYGGTSTQFGLPVCTSGTLTSPCSFVPNGGYCSAVNHTTGAGYDGGNAASTAGLAPMANIIRLTEIYQIGHINHGLRGVTTCVDTNNGTYPSKLVFPANVPSGAPANTCANAGVSATNRPPEGALFYLDYTQAQLDCFDPSKPGTVCGGVNKLIGWQFALIEAVTFYGITMEDTGNGSSISLPGIESEQGYYFYDVNGFPGAKAQADAFTAYMNANCSGATCTVARRCTDANNAICANGHSQWQWGINAWANISLVGGLDIIGHMHVADPCVVIALQGLPNDGKGTNACP